ncbi:hypothetical protein P3S68_015053 [Capsicum galapagoense]
MLVKRKNWLVTEGEHLCDAAASLREDNVCARLESTSDYFRWIYDDLWPWREIGITEEMLMRATSNAEFRLVIVNGRAYVETYRNSFQSCSDRILSTS